MSNRKSEKPKKDRLKKDFGKVTPASLSSREELINLWEERNEGVPADDEGIYRQHGRRGVIITTLFWHILAQDAVLRAKDEEIERLKAQVDKQ